ncbi:hypothetical protein [Roseicitreum antarcticum]|uniref:Flagellar basal body rod protein FlgB n=1 Tax=Roseicitreum antarcticum TaxID=564137 RepID=A0A1H3A1M3_9RHOB|nr:hypothetical protein [Roseicitreum antarcticum]SDX23670.1 flagellar basal-body rod protein FlgB [Roseicitreum antarcticum]
MFRSLELSRMAQAMATHAAKRQSVISQNVAHADTPGYRAQDVHPFSDVYGTTPDRLTLRTTHEGHLPGRAAPGFAAGLRAVDRSAATGNVNGNSVSLENEMVQAATTRLSYETALGVYSSLRAITRAARGG